MENCQQVESNTTLYKPCLQDNSSGGGGGGGGGDNKSNNSLNRESIKGVELMCDDQCQRVPQMNDSHLVGNVDVAIRGDGGVSAENGVKGVEMSSGKRRRGRPPKNQVRNTSSAPPPPPFQRKVEDEEDVCFICFDGGSLVLCDRRGCPKAYHPACIKRDEAYFKSKAKWNCGWHICSTCQKASYYMCYTCTYSLCKNCTKDADYVNVRGNKGFCGTCMRTILLIENSALGNKEVQVDFDDKTSWEYLFKVYWVLLKGKLSLTLDELTKAKNPWKEIALVGPKGESLCELNNGSSAKGANLENSSGDLGASYSKRRKTMKQQKFLNGGESQAAAKLGVMTGMPLPECTNWATKELLEFVAYMKNGDTSTLSRFDVQGLLLEYITRSNLRDPRQKSHILCDSMLFKLFGRSRVGHFEMLKLLESHFLNQNHSRAFDTIRGIASDANATQLAVDGNNDTQSIMANDKRRKARKNVDEKGQKANPDEFAAVDVHNMNLIYLRRNLIENLIDDANKFNDKVVGTFVRIKIPGGEQKQDMYRLVQVVGTSKAADPYKIGERATDVMLEILNLDRKELVSIDGVSNQDFAEDECQRIHERIKCGLMKRFTVGEIQEKAMALQAVRVNDWLESEILRVKNLRDRASEKGLMKELRECVEKLQLLNSPGEHQRRLLEVPDVHRDPDMNLYSKYEEVARVLDEKKKENSMKPSILPHPTGKEQSVPNTETDKVWHYQDPYGRTQGPFTMGMLRKWSCHFPPDLRIWRVGEKQEDAILLSDILSGQCNLVQQLVDNSCATTEETKITTGDRCKNGDGDMRDSTDLSVTDVESKQFETSRQNDISLTDVASKQFETSNSRQNDRSSLSGGDSESVKSKELSSQSSPCTAAVDIVKSDAVQAGSPLPRGESVKGGDDIPGQPRTSCSLLSPALSGKPCEGNGVERLDCGSINMNENLSKTSGDQIIDENLKQDHTEGKSGKSHSSNEWDSNSGLISLARALEVAEHKQGMDFPDLPTSTTKLNHEDSKGQDTKDRPYLASNLPHQDSGPSWSTASSIVGNGPQLPEVAGEWCGYSSTPAKPSAQEWNSDLVPESALRPTVLGSDHAATPTSGSGQLTHSSPADPANNASGWDPIVAEPNEYSLGDESVSDLLAEVEAMESLNGLASPTSMYRCDGTQVSEHDCFSPVGGLSPAPDPGKSDALSSTNDLQVHSRSTLTVELFGVSPSEVLDAQKSSGGHSSTSAEMDEDTRPSDVSVNQYEAGSETQPPAPPVTTWGMTTVNTPWRPGPETTSTNWGAVQGAVQGNPNFNWADVGSGTTNINWGTGQGTIPDNGSINSGTSAGNSPYFGNQHQQRYGSVRDRDFQARDSNYGRGRSSWNRQSSYNGGSNRHSSYGDSNGAGFYRPPPKGQRVCKYYDNGYCKKGASCSFWHP